MSRIDEALYRVSNVSLNEMALGEMSQYRKSEIVPEHKNYYNNITPQMLTKIIIKNNDTSKGLDIIKGALYQIIEDFNTDINVYSNEADKEDVKKHYNKYLDAINNAIIILNKEGKDISALAELKNIYQAEIK